MDAYDAMPMEQEKSREFSYSRDHGPTMVFTIDHGACVTVASKIFLGCVAENAHVLLYKLIPQQQKRGEAYHR